MKTPSEEAYDEAVKRYNWRPFFQDFKMPKMGIYSDSSCPHEWVDVGFNHSKMVCKKCDIEQCKMFNQTAEYTTVK